MRRREITSSLFWLIVGLILTIWSATYPIGNLAQPGTGFLPLGLGILLLIFSAVLLIRAFKLGAAEKEKIRMLPEAVVEPCYDCPCSDRMPSSCSRRSATC